MRRCEWKLNSRWFEKVSLECRKRSRSTYFGVAVTFCDWSKKKKKKPALLSQPIRYTTKTNNDLFTHVFPRFIQLDFFSLQVSIYRLLVTFSHALTGLFCGFSFGSNKLYRKELCWQMVKQSSRVANFTLVKPPEGTLGIRVRVHVPWFEVGLGFVNGWPPKTISSFFIVQARNLLGS